MSPLKQWPLEGFVLRRLFRSNPRSAVPPCCPARASRLATWRLMLLFPAAACTTWTSVAVPAPMAAVAGDTTRAGVALAQRGRVTGSRGEVYELREVTVWWDSLIGWRGNRDAPERAGMSLTEVRSIERRTSNILGTTLLVIGVTAAVVIVLAVASASLVGY